jgi:hypothetical protein
MVMGYYVPEYEASGIPCQGIHEGLGMYCQVIVRHWDTMPIGYYVLGYDGPGYHIRGYYVRGYLGEDT